MHQMPPERGSHRRVLIADENVARSTAWAASLLEEGYEVVLTERGEEAWDRFHDGRFGTVISALPISSPQGRELLRRIRSEDPEGYSYFILAVDLTEIVEIERAMMAGVDDFLSRSVDPIQMLARVRVAVRIGRMRDEIFRKAHALGETNQRLEQVNQRMRNDLSAAVRVQQVLLPKPTLAVPGMDVAWSLRPCTQLAGDLLNCMRLDEHHAAFYVLDVSGHGVSSALLSVQVARLMSPLLAESEILKERLTESPWYRIADPVQVLAKLNRMFQATLDCGQYFTMIYGVLHQQRGELRLAAAGHPGAIVVPCAGDPRVLESSSHPVGLLENPTFCEETLTLGAGDRIWLYSDGLTEATDSDERMLGSEGLMREIAERRGQGLERAVCSVMESVEQRCGPTGPGDDCSLLAMELKHLPTR